MLPKENRLKRKKDIENVWKHGKSQRFNSLLLKAVKNNLAKTRFAFIVSVKVAKKAVKRNKLKRRLREIIRKKLPQIKPGFDVIISALVGLTEKNFQQLEEIVDKLLEKTALKQKTKN